LVFCLLVSFTFLLFCYCCLSPLSFFLFFFFVICRSLCSSLFPYTTLFRSLQFGLRVRFCLFGFFEILFHFFHGPGRSGKGSQKRDRKSTRLNSSHLGISYAVFCLKKKKKKNKKTETQKTHKIKIDA